jgi:hypothetical protein
MKRSMTVLALAMLAAVGCGPEKKFALVNAWLTRIDPPGGTAEAPARLSPVAFVAPTGKPLFVSLPVGEDAGSCASFTVRTDGKMVALTDVFVSYGSWNGSGDATSESFLGGTEVGAEILGKANEPLKVYSWQYGTKEKHADYAVYVQVEPLDAMPPAKDGACEYKGQRYHLLQSTGSSITRFGK